MALHVSKHIHASVHSEAICMIPVHVWLVKLQTLTSYFQMHCKPWYKVTRDSFIIATNPQTWPAFLWHTPDVEVVLCPGTWEAGTHSRSARTIICFHNDVHKNQAVYQQQLRQTIWLASCKQVYCFFFLFCKEGKLLAWILCEKVWIDKHCTERKKLCRKCSIVLWP